MRWFGAPARLALPRAAGAREARATGREVDRLAGPIVAEGLFQTALDLTNIALVGRLGTAALSGVGAATQLVQLGVAALAAVSVGGMVLTAQAYGARAAGAQDRHPGQAAGQALLVSVVVGVVCGLPAIFFASPLLRLIGASPAVADEGAIYLQLAGAAFPALALMTVAGAVLRGSGDSRTPMAAMGLTNVVNVALSAGLILGPPALGVTGAAIGAAVARVVGAAFLTGLLWRSGKLAGARLRPDRAIIRRLLGVGLPSMGEQVILSVGLLAYGLLTLGLGTTVYAAQRITLTLIGFAWMPAFGYGAAATALVGQAIGAADPARSRDLARLAARNAIAWMSGLAVVCFLFADQLVGAFTSDPAVRSTGATGLRVLCLGQPFWGLGQTYAGALRGAGDTRYPMWATAAGVWLVRMPVAWFCGYVLGFGLPGIYVSNGVDAGARALLVYRRFAAGRWRERLKAREAGAD